MNTFFIKNHIIINVEPVPRHMLFKLLLMLQLLLLLQLLIPERLLLAGSWLLRPRGCVRISGQLPVSVPGLSASCQLSSVDKAAAGAALSLLQLLVVTARDVPFASRASADDLRSDSSSPDLWF